jgi:hypothetical protein
MNLYEELGMKEHAETDCKRIIEADPKFFEKAQTAANTRTNRF